MPSNCTGTGKVEKIIFTGGQGNRNELTEAAAARHYAIKNGIPERDILIEESSHTTYENVVNAKHVADANGLKKVLIVSDPMHMRRAVTMARDVGLEATLHQHQRPSIRAGEVSWSRWQMRLITTLATLWGKFSTINYR